ncbi:UPF0692 protein C19orf54 [Nymphon striatum]|nr:UPF0692 protein C19orf54 [Nymphon striatum]
MYLCSSECKMYFTKIILLYGMTFLVILPYFCHDAVHSIYFRSLEKYNALAAVERKNSARLESANSYFKSIVASKSKLFYKNKLKCQKLQILIVIVTAKRNQLHNVTNSTNSPGYLTQSMAALDMEIRRSNDDCDVVHPSHKWQHLTPGKVKEKHDKVACFREGLKYKFDYLLMVEDDATSKWAYVNFHFPEEWQGYSKIVMHYFELAGIGIIGGTLFLSFPFLHSTNKKRQISTFIFGTAFSILVVFCIGRQYFLNILSLIPNLHRLKVPAPGCCTPATLFPQIHLPGLVDYLDDFVCTKRYGIDLAISDFAKIHELQRILLSQRLSVGQQHQMQPLQLIRKGLTSVQRSQLWKTLDQHGINSPLKEAIDRPAKREGFTFNRGMGALVSIDLLYADTISKESEVNHENCGIAALCMASKLYYQEPLDICEVIKVAVDRKISALGEMFSVEKMGELCEGLFPENVTVKQSKLENFKELMTHILLNKGVILVPLNKCLRYDQDGNYEPCLRKGHSAHWGVILGVICQLPSKEALDNLQISYDTTDLGFHKIISANENAVTKICELHDPEDTWFLCMQGKSKYMAAWHYPALLSSNDNLIEIVQHLKYKVEFILPDGSIEAGLRGKCLLINS